MSKSIGIIITRLGTGGAERVAANLSLELSRYYNVILIVFDCSEVIYPHGGELHCLNTPPGSGFIGKIINLLLRTARTRAIKKKRNIQCTISLLDGPNIVNILSKARDKTIASFRNFRSHELKDHPLTGRLSTRIIARFSDAVVVPSKAVLQDLVDNFKIKRDKLHLIYNMCQIEPFCAEKSDTKTPNESGIFAAMGRMVLQKGQWHLIRAFAKVLHLFPDAKLYIIGDGKLHNELKELAEQLQIERNIIMTGFLKTPNDILANCDVFVLPSVFEGLGNVILEAMALGLPIISTDCDAGPREILAPDTKLDAKSKTIEYAQYGVLVPNCGFGHFNSTDALTMEENLLADAMIRLIVDKELRDRYCKLSLERIVDFSPDIIVSEWRKLIKGSGNLSEDMIKSR